MSWCEVCAFECWLMRVLMTCRCVWLILRWRSALILGGERAWLIRDTQGEDNRESFQCLWWISLPDLEQNLLLSSEQNQLLTEFADESTMWLCFRSDLIAKNIHILFKIIICSERLQQCIAICSGGQSTQIKYLSKSTDTYNKILLQ